MVIKDKKSDWFLETGAPEATCISDRDYAIVKLPKELHNAVMLVRTSEDATHHWLPIGRLTALEDCTAYAAILWNPTEKQSIKQNDFRRLAQAGWREVEGTFETTGMATNSEWKVL